MENSTADKKTNLAKASGSTSICIRKEPKKHINADLTRINKKDFGKVVRFDDYLALAISMITPEHLQRLQEGSLSNAGRLARDYVSYIAEFGHLSKDVYLGKRLNGEIKSKEPPTSTQEQESTP